MGTPSSTGAENVAFDSHGSREIFSTSSGTVSVTGSDSANNPISSVQSVVQYRAYNRRWFVLAVISILNMANAMLWISYAPVANYSNAFYCTARKDCGAADLLSLIFMIVAIPVGFVAMWCVDKYGLRSGILLGSSATLVGAGIRIISSMDLMPVSARLAMACFGQAVAACAQPFIMYLPPKLAALWFPENQRATANTVGSMANPLGILIAMLISPQIVRGPNDILLLNGIMAIPAAIVACLATFGVCSSLPPTPPTSSAAEMSLPFFAGLKSALRIKAFWVLMISLGGGMGLFNAIYTLIQQILCPKGYSNDFAGLCGALLIVGGLFGAAVTGIIVDKTKKFVLVAKISYAGAALFACLFSVLSLRGNLAPAIAVATTFFGALGFAIYPIGLEMGVECTYPVAEATSAGLIIISGQLQGIIFVILMQVLQRSVSEVDSKRETCSAGTLTKIVAYDWTISNILWCSGATGLAVCFVLFFWPTLKRREAEALNMNQQINRPENGLNVQQRIST